MAGFSDVCFSRRIWDGHVLGLILFAGEDFVEFFLGLQGIFLEELGFRFQLLQLAVEIGDFVAGSLIFDSAVLELSNSGSVLVEIEFRGNAVAAVLQ